MEYRKEFIELIDSLKNENNKNLRFVGFGNPNSKILIIGKECSFDLKVNRIVFSTNWKIKIIYSNGFITLKTE